MDPNEQLFRILIEDGFSKGDITLFDKHTSPDFIEHQYGSNPPNVEGVKNTIKKLHNAFSDFSLSIEELVTKGDKVWGRMTAHGTHTGHFGPIPPTGKRFTITIIDIMRFKERKLIEHWGVSDRFAMMEQIGIKPPQRTD
jgi:predicted ester cyclase